jgi:ERCC4-type nuclease
MHILIDTREQSPWAFEPYIQTSTGTIRSGDYALAGDQHRFAIERKSLDDFLGTIGSGWPRFCRELQRMEAAGFPARVIIVEGDYATCAFHQTPSGELIPPQHRHWLLSPQFVESRVAALTMRGVSVLFAGNSELAAALAVSIFKHRQIQIQNHHESNQNRNTTDPQL